MLADAGHRRRTVPPTRYNPQLRNDSQRSWVVFRRIGPALSARDFSVTYTFATSRSASIRARDRFSNFPSTLAALPVNSRHFLSACGLLFCLSAPITVTQSVTASGGELDRSLPVGTGDSSSQRGPRDAAEDRVWRRLTDAAEAADSRISRQTPAVRRFIAALHELETARIEEVHRWLHDRILTGAYRESLHDVMITLETGDYNCLTAAILFKVACERAGLPVRFAVTAQHVSCLACDGRWIEPTCADWFRDEYRMAMMDQSRRESEAARDIGWQGLLARVCYNRGVARLAAGDFSGAANDFASACRRDAAFEEAAENQLATLNNWALACCAERKYAEAIARLQAARALDPHSPLVEANELHINHQWSVWLCESGSYREALALLECGRVGQPQAALYQYGPPAVARQWLDEMNRQQPSPENSRIRAELTARYPDAAAAACRGRAASVRSGHDP